MDATPRRRLRWYQYSLRSLCVLTLLVVLAALWGVVSSRFSNYTDIRNVCGKTVTDVVLQLQDHQTEWTVSKRVARLEPGESLRVYHSHNDTRAIVEFAIAGRRFRHQERYIDLWTGEGWCFDIQPDGTVSSGYVHRDRD
jgi:hypothetical protein